MNLFFVEIGSPYSFDLAAKLETLGATISHVTTTRRRVDYAAFTAPRECAVVHSPDLYNVCKMYKKYKGYYVPLEADLYAFFKNIEHDFMVLTDRTNYKPLPFRKRKNLFFDLIRFWVGYLQKENIDAVYFPCTPHAGWELVLMHACKYLNVPCCYLSHTAINNRSMFRSSYTEIERVPAVYMPGSSIEDIRKDIEPELLKDFDEESIVTNVIKLENDMFQQQGGVNSQEDRFQTFLNKDDSIDLFKKAVQGIKKVISQWLYQIRGESFYFPMAMDRFSSPLHWGLAVLKHKFLAYQLKNFYKNHAQELDFDTPYIYFPLHLQPELTSQPEAGLFEDQLVALETLLLALPKGWKVYLKDNPRQFDPTINTVSAIHYRDRSDLERFLAHDNVVLVPQSEPSEKLISKAKITATLTGTAGWESLNMGRPCILFGHPWYSPCRSCFTVQSPADVTSALEAAQDKMQQDVELDLFQYIHFFQDRLKIASLHAPSDVSYNSRPYDEILLSHAQALTDFFEDLSQTKVRSLQNAV